MLREEDHQDTPVVGAVRYAAQVDLTSNTTQAKVARLVGYDKRVLELGPSTGGGAAALRERGCQTVGIEMDPEAAALAEQSCERVIVADIEQLDWDAALGDDRFDVVVAADVLEHLKEPGRVLQAAHRFLKPDGYLVASLPNIAHFSVRLALLGGSFPYSEMGLLDRTHLRFYTRESMERLFEDAGFVVGYLERQEDYVPDCIAPYDPGQLPPDRLASLTQDPDARAFQFIVIAYPLPRADLVRLRERFHELVYAREEAERRARELETELTAAQAEARALEAAQAQARALEEALAEQRGDLTLLRQYADTALEREASLRGMLMEAHDQLLLRDDELLKLRQTLVQSQEGLAFTQQTLSDTQHALTNAQEGLAFTQQTLSDTQRALADTQRALADTQQALADTQQALAHQEQAHAATRQELANANATVQWMLNTRSWRLIERVWGLRRMLRPSANQ